MFLTINIQNFRHTTKMVETTLPTTSVCPNENGNIKIAEQCVRVDSIKRSYAEAVKTCGELLGLVAGPIDEIQTTILG